MDEAQNSFEALQQIENNDYDVVLMDLNMPYMDGLETSKKIRENFSGKKAQVPILLLHSSAEDGFIQRQCKELSIKLRLSKPIKNNELFEALSKLTLPAIEKSKDPSVEIELSKHRSKGKVLIAEDNAINMFLAKTIVLKVSPQIEIIEATDGLDACALAIEHLPDIILMDIQMPVMSGHEATRKIKADPRTKDIPIVAITAGTIKGEKEKCLESGMSDFVPKPIVEKNIRYIFDKWLKVKEQHVESEQETLSAIEPSNGIKTQEQKPHFDVDKVKEYLGDEPDIIKEVLKLTIHELEQSRKILLNHYNDKNLEGLNSEGHKLKGSALTAGLGKIFEIALTLEEMPTLDLVVSKKLIDRYNTENEIVKDLINEYINNGN